ncbi:MAG TPA: YoaK family protein [Acidimicrobiia bacterium]
MWLLALAAGFVIAVAYQQLSKIEVGPQSGNVVAVTANIARDGTAAALTRLYAVVAFVFGIAAAIAIAEEGARRQARRVLAVTIGVETVLLIGFTLWLAHFTHGTTVRVPSHWQLDGIVVLAAFALGLQTGALRRVGGQTARTVYISGMLTRVAEESVRLVYWRRDRARGNTVSPWFNEPTLRHVMLLGGIIGAYAVGALAGSWSNDQWGPVALLAPIVLLAGVALLDAVVAPGPPSR